MSWHTFKSLSIEQINPTNIEGILSRCGRFLTRLNLVGLLISENIMNIVAKECPNLKVIELDKSTITLDSLKAIKPIFENVEEFIFEINEVDDENLEELFTSNKKLKILEMRVHNDTKLRGTFLAALPRETLTRLDLCHTGIEDMSFLCRLSALKSIRLNEAKVTNDTLIGISKNCLDLTSLELSGESL